MDDHPIDIIQVAIEGQDDSYDFGSGAGFYVDATTEKWKKHYNMYTYITQVPNLYLVPYFQNSHSQELPELISGLFPVDPEKRSITGHSMGGHGALVCHLKNPGMYSSVSAFSPICNPTVVPWGEKVNIFSHSFGTDSLLSGLHWLLGLCGGRKGL